MDPVELGDYRTIMVDHTLGKLYDSNLKHSRKIIWPQSQAL